MVIVRNLNSQYLFLTKKKTKKKKTKKEKEKKRKEKKRKKNDVIVKTLPKL